VLNLVAHKIVIKLQEVTAPTPKNIEGSTVAAFHIVDLVTGW
jgi:hypothetical protein